MNTLLAHKQITHNAKIHKRRHTQCTEWLHKRVNEVAWSKVLVVVKEIIIYWMNECRTLVDLLAPDQPLPLLLSTRWPNTHNNSNNNKRARRPQVPCALGKSTLTTEMCRYGESLDCFVSPIVVSVILFSGNSNERDVRKGKFYLWICGCPCTQTLIVVIELFSSQVVDRLTGLPHHLTSLNLTQPPLRQRVEQTLKPPTAIQYLT